MVEKYQFAVRKYLLNDNDLLHFCIFNIDFPMESQRPIHVKPHHFFMSYTPTTFIRPYSIIV